ncbi:MAG: VOC family protein [Acidobacteriia bacterium]|nr:VOC family protein [Terriglobia bacterium]
MISRRTFLAVTTGALLAPSLSWTESEFPIMLDHILLGCNDLDQGIAFVEEHTGIRAAFGGVHPGRGTRNALLSLGDQHYLEIIAPDPKQDSAQPFAAQTLATIKGLSNPRLIGWAAHPGDIEALAKKLHDAGIATQGPWPGSRARPDGRVLSWKSLVLADDRHGLLPFFIEWSADSVHPSVDAPAGCRLERFAVADPDPAGLERTFQRLGIDVPVERGERPQLRARINGPKGKFEVSS